MKIDREEIYPLLCRFEDHLKKCGLKKTTAHEYVTVSRSFLCFLEENDLSVKHLKSIRDFQKARKAGQMESILRRLYQFLEIEKVVEKNPLGDLRHNWTLFGPNLQRSSPGIPSHISHVVSGFKEYLTQCGYANRSVRFYLCTLGRFLKFAKSRPLKDPALLKDFLSARKIHRTQRTALRAFYGYLKSRKIVRVVPKEVGQLNPNFSFPRPGEDGPKLNFRYSEPVTQVSAPEIKPLADTSPDPLDQPADNFTVLRLKREIEFLKSDIARLLGAIRYKDTVLAEQRDLWRLGLHHGVWPTVGESGPLLKRIESAIEFPGPAVPDRPIKQTRIVGGQVEEIKAQGKGAS